MENPAGIYLKTLRNIRRVLIQKFCPEAFQSASGHCIPAKINQNLHYHNLFCNLSFSVSTEKNTVINIFVSLRYPHRKFSCCYSSLSVKHSCMERYVAELSQYQFHSRMFTVFRTFIQHLICERIKICESFFSTLSR